MNKILISFLFAALGICGICQEAVQPKLRWTIEGGINMLIPIRQYNESCDPKDVADAIHSRYRVTPYFTAKNFFFDATCSYNIHSGQRSDFGMRFGLSYRHRELMLDKEGHYSGGFAGSTFNGTVEETSQYEDLFPEYGLYYEYSVRKWLKLSNQFTVSGFHLLHRYRRIHQDGEFDYMDMEVNYSDNKWLYPIGIFASYTFQLDFRVVENFNITYRMEIPLLISKAPFADEPECNGLKPNGIHQQLTSINNICMIDLGFGISYHFGNCKKI